MTISTEITFPLDQDLAIPNADIGAVVLDFTGGTSNLDEYEVIFNNITDNETLDGATWVAGQDFAIVNSVSGTPATPTSLTATFFATWDFAAGKDIEIKARARNAAGVWGPYDTISLLSGEWEDGTDVTFETASANTATGSITSPVDDFVIDEDHTDFIVSGTVAGAPASVEMAVNGGTPFAVTNTGTNFDTWTATVDRTTHSLEDGDAVTLELLLDSVTADTATGRINERPDLPVISGITENQILPPNAALPSFAITVNDATDGINLIRFILRRLSDGWHWDGAAWVAPLSWNNSTQTYTNAELPTTYTFQDGVDGVTFPTDLGVSTDYTLFANVRDASGTNESSTGPGRTFSTGTPPTANADTYTVGQDTSTDLDVLANDDNVAAGAVITIVTQPSSGGTATVNP